MWNHSTLFNIKTPNSFTAVRRLMICLLLLIVSLFMVTGCGGGGGGGSNNGGGGPVVADVMIGTIEFRTDSSINLSGLDADFPINSDWVWTWTTGGSGFAMTQEFDPIFIVVNGQNLPVLKMTSTSTEGGLSSWYSYWAVARNGNLYNLTAGLKGEIEVGQPHVMVSEPRIVTRKNYASQSWTDGVPGNVGGRNDPTWTRQVVSTSTTSPAGFTQCIQVRITLPVGNPDGIQTIDEYWKEGYGCVENYETLVGGAPGDKFVRQGIAFSG